MGKSIVKIKTNQNFKCQFIHRWDILHCILVCSKNISGPASAPSACTMGLSDDFLLHTIRSIKKARRKEKKLHPSFLYFYSRGSLDNPNNCGMQAAVTFNGKWYLEKWVDIQAKNSRVILSADVSIDVYILY